MNGKALLTASALLATGNTAGRILALGTAVLAARLLSVAEFGSFGLIQTTIGMFGILAGLSLGWMATHYVAKYAIEAPSRAREIAAFVLVIGVATSALAALLLWAAAPALAVHSLSHGTLAPVLRVAAVHLFISSVFGILTGILSGLKRFGLNSLANVVQNALMLPATWLLIPKFGVSGAMAGQAAGFAAGGAFALWHVLPYVREVRPRELPAIIRREIGLISSFCLPALASSLMILPAMWVAQTILSGQRGGLEQVAVFTAADRFRQLILFLANFVSVAAFPMLSGIRSEQSGHFGRTLEISLIMCSFWTVPMACALAMVAPVVMGVFGKAYQGSPEVLLWILGWAVAAAFSSILGTGLTAAGRMWLQVWQGSVYGLVLVATVWLRRGDGALGLSHAYLAATFAQLAWSAAWLWRAHRISLRSLGIVLASLFWVAVFCTGGSSVPAEWRWPLAPAAFSLSLVWLFGFVLTAAERRSLFAGVRAGDLA